MRWRTLPLVIVGVASHAYAKTPTYTLDDRTLVVDNNATRIDIECKHGYALAQRRLSLLVACGEDGVAVFSLNQPDHPLYMGLEPHPCFELDEKGICTNPREVDSTTVLPSHQPAWSGSIWGESRAAIRKRAAALEDFRIEHTEFADVPMMIIGLTMFVLGGASCFTGVGFIGAHDEELRSAGVAMSILGGASIVFGVPLFVVGSKRVPIGSFSARSVALRF